MEKRPEVPPAAAPRGRAGATTNGGTWGQFGCLAWQVGLQVVTLGLTPLLCQLVAPRIATDALFAASCKVFDER